MNTSRHIDEPIHHYASFLCAGSYPILKLALRNGLLATASGLLMLALVTSSAGYLLTQWLVPPGSQRWATASASLARPRTMEASDASWASFPSAAELDSQIRTGLQTHIAARVLARAQSSHTAAQ